MRDLRRGGATSARIARPIFKPRLKLFFLYCPDGGIGRRLTSTEFVSLMRPTLLATYDIDKSYVLSLSRYRSTRENNVFRLTKNKQACVKKKDVSHVPGSSPGLDTITEVLEYPVNEIKWKL